MSSAGEFTPSAEEAYLAQEGYTRYLLGAVILHDPVKTTAIHGRDPESEADRRIIMVYADSLMLGGLRNVIRFANPSDSRSLSALEFRYDASLPQMIATVENTFTEMDERIVSLNSGLHWLRPAPMTDRVVYGYLTHPRLGKLTSLRLMDSLLPADVFAPHLRDRTLDYLSKETDSAYLIGQTDAS